MKEEIRMKLEHAPASCTKINATWIKGLNVKPDTIKILEENIEHSLTNITARSFFDLPPRVVRIKTKISK